VGSLDQTEQIIETVNIFVKDCGVEGVVTVDQSSTAKRSVHAELKVADECYFVLELIAHNLGFKEFIILGD